MKKTLVRIALAGIAATVVLFVGYPACHQCLFRYSVQRRMHCTDEPLESFTNRMAVIILGMSPIPEGFPHL